MHHLIAGNPSLLLVVGLKQLISSMGDTEVTQTVGLARNDILQLIQSCPPDFLWIESSGVELEAIKLCEQITNAGLKVKIMVVCDNKDSKTIKGFLQAKVAAYLLPYCITSDVEAAICAVSQNSVYIDANLQQQLVNHMLNLHDRKTYISPLTKREKEVLRLIVEENTTHEIATKLYINSCTVETHRLHLIQKMGVKNTAGLVREALVRKLYAYP